MTAAPSTEARETSGATTGGLLRYVRREGGDQAVARMLEIADVPYTAEQLDDQSLWWSYDTRIRLFAAATEVLDDPRTMFKVGASALHSGLAHSLVLLLRAMGSPRTVFQRLPRAVAKFTTTSTMEIVESGAVSATIRYTLHPGLPALAARLRVRARASSPPCRRSSACRPRGSSTTSASPTVTGPASTA